MDVDVMILFTRVGVRCTVRGNGFFLRWNGTWKILLVLGLRGWDGKGVILLLLYLYVRGELGFLWLGSVGVST